MSKAPKVDRKELKTPDSFVMKGRATLQYIFGGRGWVIPSLVGVGILILIGYGYDHWKTRALEKAWTLYYEVTKAPEAERWEKYKKLYQDLGDNRARFMAAVQVADHAFDAAKKASQKKEPELASQSASAVEWYAKALGFSGLTQQEKQLLLVNRAHAYQVGGQWTEALAELQKSIDMGGDLKALALLEQGSLFEAKSEWDKAIQTYERVRKEHPDSESAKQALNYLRRLRSPLFQVQSGKAE